MNALRFLPLVLLLPAASLAQNVNVALGGTATQNTTYSGYTNPPFAIDGNRDGYWWNNSCTVTGNVQGSWWQVALANPSLVNEVVVWNRSDCCGDRLSSFRIDVLNGTNIVFSQSYHTDRAQVPLGGHVRMRIPGPGVNATAVKVSNIGINAEQTYYLQFAEVEVIRYGAFREINYARYGTATDSSGSTIASRAIDDHISGYVPNNKAWIQTTPTPNWLNVAMERHRVDVVRLWPVTSGMSPLTCGNFRVGLHDNGVEVWGQDFLPQQTMSLTQPLIVTPPLGTYIDAIRISLLGPNLGVTQLAFAEVESVAFEARGESWDFGAGCRQSGGVPPTLRCTVRPVVGANLQFALTDAPMNGISLLVTGLSNQVSGALPLPFDLGLIGAPSCTSLVSLDVTQAAIATGTTSAYAFQIPTVGALGVTIYQQAACLSAPSNALGIIVSNAIEQFIGL